MEEEAEKPVTATTKKTSTKATAALPEIAPEEVVRRCIGVGKSRVDVYIKRLGEKALELPKLYGQATAGDKFSRDRLREILTQ